MGTPVACDYATIFQAYIEQKVLITKWGKKFHLFKRFLNDGLVAITQNATMQTTIDQFLHELNSFGLLKWTVTKPSNTIDFLNVTLITDIINGEVSYRPCAKAMALYLYPPSHSAHPPGVTKSIINGLLRVAYRLSSKREYSEFEVRKLYRVMKARGHPADKLCKYFLAAGKNTERMIKRQLQNIDRGIGRRCMVKKETTLIEERLFYHVEFHPHNISRQTIRNLYDNILQDVLRDEVGIKQLTVAYHRPRNLRDMIAPSRIHKPIGKEVSTYLKR